MTNYRFVRRLNDGSTYHLGTAVQSNLGWRFIPNVSSHRSSRKFHPTMAKCLPRWVGYPDRCDSFAVGDKSKLDSIECPHCHWGFAPTVIQQHIHEKHGDQP
jgi:hypothetical protein